MPTNVLGPHQGAFDRQAQKDIANSVGYYPNANNNLQDLSGSADVVDFPGTYFINTAGVDAITPLRTPVSGDQFSGGDDGKTLTLIDKSGNAHTFTTATNGIVNSKHLLTFNGTKGSFVELQAKDGIWYVMASSGVAVS